MAMKTTTMDLAVDATAAAESVLAPVPEGALEHWVAALSLAMVCGVLAGVAGVVADQSAVAGHEAGLWGLFAAPAVGTWLLVMGLFVVAALKRRASFPPALR
jgi:hypothetical protein